MTLQHPYSINFNPEYGDIVVLTNDGNLPYNYTASQYRRQRLESSSPWKPQISRILPHHYTVLEITRPRFEAW